MIVVHLHCGVGTFASRTGVQALIWRISSQLGEFVISWGESFLNLFLLHEVENL